MAEILTRTGLRSKVDTQLPSGTGAIVATDHRDVEDSLIDSLATIFEAEVRVINMTTTTPPGGASDRDAYVVASGATGAWSGEDDEIAIWDDDKTGGGGWQFSGTPKDGQAVWNLDDDKQYRWDTSISPAAWVATKAVHSDATAELSVGYSHTPHSIGTISSGTLTPDEANGGMQNYTNGGAHTLAPPSNSTSLHIVVTNGSSAGAIDTTNFSIVTGDPLTTTNADGFILNITRNGGISQLHVTALQ